MVHCTLNGLIYRHKHVKDLLVQHLGELLAHLRPSPALHHHFMRKVKP